MKANKNRLDQLAKGYWDATLSGDEEVELRALLATESDLGEETEALKIMMGGFSEIAKEEELNNEKAVIAPLVAPKSIKPARIIKLALSTVAAAAVVAIGIVSFFESSAPEAPQQQEVYCYINGEPITDLELALEQTKYLKPVATLSQTINTIESLLN